jgi:prepilin signal peptidase PulO-like enzyme (type II secretory pathway)
VAASCALVIEVNHMAFIAFMVFSINSVIADMRSYKVRVHEIILGFFVIADIRVLAGFSDWTSSLIGAGLGGLSFWAIRKLAKGRLGLGDIWYSAFMGFSFGFRIWDAATLLGAFLAGLWIVLRWLRNRRYPIKGLRIPFLPFLFAGAVISFAYKGFHA